VRRLPPVDFIHHFCSCPTYGVHVTVLLRCYYSCCTFLPFVTTFLHSCCCCCSIVVPHIHSVRCCLIHCTTCVYVVGDTFICSTCSVHVTTCCCTGYRISFICSVPTPPTLLFVPFVTTTLPAFCWLFVVCSTTCSTLRYVRSTFCSTTCDYYRFVVLFYRFTCRSCYHDFLPLFTCSLIVRLRSVRLFVVPVPFTLLYVCSLHTFLRSTTVVPLVSLPLLHVHHVRSRLPVSCVVLPALTDSARFCTCLLLLQITAVLPFYVVRFTCVRSFVYVGSLHVCSRLRSGPVTLPFYRSPVTFVPHIRCSFGWYVLSALPVFYLHVYVYRLFYVRFTLVVTFRSTFYRFTFPTLFCSLFCYCRSGYRYCSGTLRVYVLGLFCPTRFVYRLSAFRWVYLLPFLPPLFYCHHLPPPFYHRHTTLRCCSTVLPRLHVTLFTITRCVAFTLPLRCYVTCRSAVRSPLLVYRLHRLRFYVTVLPFRCSWFRYLPPAFGYRSILRLF